MISIVVSICDLANSEHADSLRQYAHTYCNGRRSDRYGVCVCSAFFGLPLAHRYGLLAHEVGHLICGYDGSESDADEAAEAVVGAIEYRDSEYGNNLQWLSSGGRKKLDRYVKFRYL